MMKKVIINIDKAFDIYRYNKRSKPNEMYHGYDVANNNFIDMNLLDEESKKHVVPFLECYSIANKVIDMYLGQPCFEEDKALFRDFVETGNRVTDILWYFEHIDGAYHFEQFEKIYVVSLIKQWCDENGFEYEGPRYEEPSMLAKESCLNEVFDITEWYKKVNGIE